MVLFFELAESKSFVDMQMEEIAYLLEDYVELFDKADEQKADVVQAKNDIVKDDDAGHYKSLMVSLFFDVIPVLAYKFEVKT